MEDLNVNILVTARVNADACARVHRSTARVTPPNPHLGMSREAAAVETWKQYCVYTKTYAQGSGTIQ